MKTNVDINKLNESWDNTNRSNWKETMNKELLTRDLGMRITHGVKVQYEQYNTMYYQEIIGCGTKYVTFDVSQCDNLDYEEGTTEHTILYLDSVKPCLFPLSMLTKEITINGETFIPADNLNEDFAHFLFDGDGKKQWIDDWVLESIRDNENIEDLPFGLVQKLIEWHFDIHGLIELGLAIDVNTLKQNPYE